jgi:hypothetical protein
MRTARWSRRLVDRRRRVPAPSAAAGLSFLAAGAGVAVWQVAERLPHGWWLITFLVLVGGVAQLLLGAGHGALARSAPSRAHSSPWRRAVSWNAGTLLVPLGVLADARLAVVLGSALLIAALGGSALELLGARAARLGRSAHWQLAYAGLLAFLGVSVVVGTVLGWDRPWL